MPGHRCPGPECDQQVPGDKLACPRHWYQVPRAIRRAVWDAWNNGAGAGTPQHTLAMDLAIRAMHR